jgi:multiple sugar transport system ATP-binding protein
MAKIRFDKLQKKFNGISVIENLDLVIEDGEFFTFVGPSGCGKSTILNMIAGLESVSGGKIYFDDTIVNELSPSERDIAMVFQSYALYPHMTVYENIAFPLRMKKKQRAVIDEEVKRVASLLGLEDLINRKPRELSGGQRQRVALGRAIIRRPEVFLMDEPLSNLDARLRIEMRAELKRLHQELSITTVYVTHDQAEAMSLSGRIAVINDGKIQQCGTPAEVYLKPSNTFVAGFIGSPPMNFIPAHMKKADPAIIDCNGLMVSPENAPALPWAKISKSELIIGIRPDDILISEEKTEGAAAVRVNLMESAGSFYWTDVYWDGIKIKGISKIDESLTAGMKAFMTIPFDKLLVFDAVTGDRL